LITILVATALLARAESLPATLARIDQGAANFHGLSADLKKISHTAVINEDTTDIGTILVKRPKPNDIRMLIDIKQPDAKQAAIDGRKAEIFYPKINTVQEWDLGKNRSLVDQFLLLGFGSSSKELQGAYSITLNGPETIAGQKATRIDLVPKSQDVLAHLKSVELWISDANGLPVQQKFDMPGGDYNLATYTNIKVNPDLPDTAVRLNLPKSVRRERPQK
jgi:outer membrane lipoprotein-sorting protein